MAILDFQNMFSRDQAVTATAVSTNTIDLGPGDAGPSERISLLVNSDGYTGAGTLSVELQTSDVVGAGGVLTTPVAVASFDITNAALLAGGKLVGARLPHGCKRYLRLNYVVDGVIAGGTIVAGLTWDVAAPEPIPTGPSGI